MCDPAMRHPRIAKTMHSILCRPLNFAACLFNGGSSLVARHDLVHTIEIFRIVLAL